MKWVLSLRLDGQRGVQVETVELSAQRTAGVDPRRMGVRTDALELSALRRPSVCRPPIDVA